MAKDFTIYIVMGAMIVIILIASIVAKFSPQQENPVIKNNSVNDEEISTNPKVSMFFNKSASDEEVIVEAASSSAARIKVGEESAWIDEGKSYTFENGVDVYVQDIHITDSENNDFEVELWVA